MIPTFTKTASSFGTIKWKRERGRSLGPKRRLLATATQWFYRKHRCSTKEQKPINHSLSHPHNPVPFVSLSVHSFIPLTISPPHHSRPLSLCPSPPISGHVGLLFMASPIEDALLYKTLEPSSRPTPFEDVAHNSYLGL